MLTPSAPLSASAAARGPALSAMAAIGANPSVGENPERDGATTTAVSALLSASTCSQTTPEHDEPRPPMTKTATSSGAGASSRTGGSVPTTLCHGPGVASRMTTPMARMPPSRRAAQGSSRRNTARSQFTSRAYTRSQGPA